MSPVASSPRKLLELLADEGADGRKLRAALHKNPRKVLKQYGVDMPPRSIPKPLRLPSAKKIQAALDTFDKRGFKHGECSEAFALLVVVIGAIPFVADGAR